MDNSSFHFSKYFNNSNGEKYYSGDLLEINNDKIILREYADSYDEDNWHTYEREETYIFSYDDIRIILIDIPPLFKQTGIIKNYMVNELEYYNKLKNDIERKLFLALLYFFDNGFHKFIRLLDDIGIKYEHSKWIW